MVRADPLTVSQMLMGHGYVIANELCNMCHFGR
jgi:hypothetical protein